jgi:hypothetical protein
LSVHSLLTAHSHHQNLEQNQNIRIANELSENVAKFKYLGTTLTNQNDIHDKINSTKIFGLCETSSLTLREEQKLRVFENKVLRRISGPKREEDGSWRKLHNDELHSLYSSPNILG